MKKYLLFIITILICNEINAQKELWSTASYYYYGNDIFNLNGVIQKCGIDGANAEIVHAFDFSEGKSPMGRLFIASNGNLYGTANLGGVSIPGASEGLGSVYEYDLILDRFTIVSHPGDGVSVFGRNPQVGFIEPVVGKLYGCGLLSVNTYNLTDGATAFVANTPIILNNAVENPIRGELMKASNGMLYGCTQNYSACPANAPFLGTIIQVNPSNNAFSVIYPFNCDYDTGAGPFGSLVEGVAGKLYGTTVIGGINGVEAGVSYGDGVLFEYEIDTNTYTKKFDFDRTTTGHAAGPLIKGLDGKLYGFASNGVTSTTQVGDFLGTLYSYDLTTNTVSILYSFYFNYATSLGFMPIGGLTLGSDGNLYGHTNGGIIKYNPTTNQMIALNNSSVENDLLEICRKPRYHFFDTDTFDTCVGSTFAYDIQNTNATTYQWLKDGDNVAGQTTGILNLNNITPTDSGNYTCVMTNECGTTTTMPLHLSVNCLGINTIANLNYAVKLYPNPASEWLNIELPQNIDVTVASCTLTNLLGQTVSQTVTNNKINVSFLQQGVYIVSLETNYGKWNGKFVKR